MLHKKLGNTNIELPAIGQGTTGVGSYQRYDQEVINNRIRVLRHGIELGMTYLDTAELYGGGLSEEVVGKVIQGRRDRVFLGTKFNPRTNVRESIRMSLEGSLKRLGTDYIDLYQVHWPNPFLPIADIMETLDRLVMEGKVRHIGVSNFSLDELNEAQLSLPDRAIVSDQVEYNLLDRSIEDDFLPFAQQKPLTVIAYSALNQGSFLPAGDRQALLDIAARHSRTVPQIILRWLISHPPVIVLSQSKTILHTEENAQASDFDLAEGDVLTINRIYRPQIIKIPSDRIRLEVSTRPVYLNRQSALDNPLDLIPSPRALATLIETRKTAKPIRLVATSDTSGRYDYDIDSYDIWDNVKKYWAWIIAHDEGTLIPAVILN